MIGFVTNRSYLDARGFDGFRKIVAQEFQEIWIIDLQSDVRRNPKISGTKHNVFGIQTGVAIGFLVRNPRREGCEIHYLAVDDFLTAIEKKRFLSSNSLVTLKKQGAFQGVLPNEAGDWINQPKNDWSAFLAVVDKMVKAEQSKEAIFRLFASSIKTNRDEWVYDFDKEALKNKIEYFNFSFNRQISSGKLNEETLDYSIKWSSTLKTRNQALFYSEKLVLKSLWRPFVKKYYYAEKATSDRLTSLHYQIYGVNLNQKNFCICFSGGSAMKPFQTWTVSGLTDYECIEKNQLVPLYIYAEDGSRQENITDWSLSKFHEHYADLTLTKLDIFHYVYAVLHDPVYRETYALNLKREFPRIPFYPDFRQWCAWGQQLMALHLGYETLEPWPLKRVEKKQPSPQNPSTSTHLPPFSKGGRGGFCIGNESEIPPSPPFSKGGTEQFSLGEGRIKPRLKADKTAGRIEIDEITSLHDVPLEAWNYRLGHRSALEWILEEYKETTPRDPTIREKFNTYRFADHKETVIDLLMRVCRVSVETMQIIAAMNGTTGSGLAFCVRNESHQARRTSRPNWCGSQTHRILQEPQQVTIGDLASVAKLVTPSSKTLPSQYPPV